MHVVTTTRFTDCDGCADSCSINCDTEPVAADTKAAASSCVWKSRVKQKSMESLRVIIRSNLGCLGDVRRAVASHLDGA